MQEGLATGPLHVLLDSPSSHLEASQAKGQRCEGDINWEKSRGPGVRVTAILVNPVLHSGSTWGLGHARTGPLSSSWSAAAGMCVWPGG